MNLDALEQRLLAAEALVEAQRQELELLAAQAAAVQQRSFAPPTHYPQDFKLYLTNNDTKVNVGQGYVFAGDLAEYDWPQDGDTTYLYADDLGAGEHLIIMQVTVDSTHGVFTTDNKPKLASVAAADHHLLNHDGQVEFLLGWAKIEDDTNDVKRFVGLRPMRGLYAPVQKYWVDDGDPPYTPFYRCRLTNFYNQTSPGGEPSDPDASSVEKCHAGE
jgi:hypothetical protein